MNNLTTELANALVLGESMTEVSRSHLEKAINKLLQVELSVSLRYKDTVK